MKKQKNRREPDKEDKVWLINDGQCRQEGEKMLTKEMELLVTENMSLAGYAVKQFLRTGIDYEELCSLAYLGLTKAGMSFNAEKAKFATYAMRVMRNEILAYLRNNKKHRQCVSYDALMCSGDEDTDTFLSIFGCEDPELERVENIGLYDFLMEDLSEREKQVVDLIIIQGKSQTDLAPQLRMSQSYISRVMRRAVRKMKMKLVM